MSGGTPEVDVCRNWYRAFDARKIDELMKLFSDHPVVFVGAGGSTGATLYTTPEPLIGRPKVEEYYEKRFAMSLHADKAADQPPDPQVPPNPIRPDCAVLRPPCIFLPWIVFSSTIRDFKDHGGYEGPYLHVFRIAEMKIDSLEMFLDPTLRASQP